MISNLEALQIQMRNFGLKGNITDEDFMFHVLNNLPKEYDMILDRLENHLTSSRGDTWTIEVICKKLSYQYEKIKNKNEEKRQKNASGAYNKQYQRRCHKCGKYSHKPNDQNVLNIKKQRKDDVKYEENDY